MTRERRLERLERKLAGRRANVCQRIVVRAFSSLSSEEYDLCQEYGEDVTVELEPSPAALAAVRSYDRALEENFRIVGFRSRQQFDEAQHRESAAGSSPSKYTLPKGEVFKDWCWRFWQGEHSKVPAGAIRLEDSLPYYTPVPMLPPEVSVMIQSWHIGATGFGSYYAPGQERCSEYSVGQVWGFVGGSAYLLEQFRAAVDVRRAEAAVRMLGRRWPDASPILIENTKAASPIIAALGEDIRGLTLVDRDPDEAQLSNEVIERLRSGQVYIPHPFGYAWVPGFVEECAAFPKGSETGQIRAMAQALRSLLEFP